MELILVEFSKEQLGALPKEEQVFLVQLTHMLNELSTLVRSVIYSSNEIGPQEEIMRTAQRVQSLFFMRMLAGKLYEGWEMLHKSYFRMKLPKQYETLLSDEARNAIKHLKQYFNRGDNLVGLIRNAWAFHYDRQKVEEEIDRIKEDAVLTMVLSEGRGNSLYEFSDTMVASSILNAINKSCWQEASDTLYGEILKVEDWFQGFGHGFVDLMVQQMLPNPSGYREVELSNVPVIGEVRLPYFVERTREVEA